MQGVPARPGQESLRFSAESETKRSQRFADESPPGSEQGEGAETGSEPEPSEAGPTEAYFSYAE